MLVVWVSSSVGIEFAVVSQSPGSCGDSGVGSTDMYVATGMCSDSDKNGVRLICAIRNAQMLLQRVAIAFARLDREMSL